MKIFNLFGKYFLALILIQGFILIFVDGRNFKKGDVDSLYNKARVIGTGWIIAGIVLFLIKLLI